MQKLKETEIAGTATEMRERARGISKSRKINYLNMLSFKHVDGVWTEIFAGLQK